MFKSDSLAEAIDRFDSQFSSRSSGDAPEIKAKKVAKIVKKNLKNESSTAKIDKMLALNVIASSDVQFEKRPKFTMPRFIK